MKPKQLVTLHEWNAYQRVLEEKRLSEDDHQVLFYPKLSILCGGDRTVIRIIGYQTRATFLIVRKPQPGRPPIPIAACDVFDCDDGAEEKINEKRSFLRERGISYCAFRVNEEKLERDSGLSFNCTGTAAAMPNKGVFNYFQYQAVMSFDIGHRNKAGERFSIIHEPSLDMIVSIGREDQKTIIEHVNREIDKERERTDKPIKHISERYLENTSVDGLFCVDVPHGIPLFAIEYDGSDHSMESEGKDRAKNILFGLLRLPLIRVSSKHYKPSDRDIALKNAINKHIAEMIASEQLREQAYIGMIMDFLGKEAERLDSRSQAGSNIKTLIGKLDGYLSRRETWHRERLDQASERAATAERLLDSEPYDPRIDELFELEREFYEEAFKNRFGLPVEEGFEPCRNGIRYVAKIKAEPHHRQAGEKAAEFSAGPYTVQDTAGIFPLVPIVQFKLKADVQRQLEEHFSSGYPPLSGQIAIANAAVQWTCETHRQRVSRYLKTHYLPSIRATFFPRVSTSGINKTKSPPEALAEIIAELNHPLFKADPDERDAVITDLKRAHRKLFEEKQAPRLLSKTDFGRYGLTALLSRCEDFYFVDLLDDPTSLRSALKAVNPKGIIMN